ncbi:uncharacterized protein HMPREF1541_09312 [Cyphellophora europaea CBS 101466]|uniref:Uncharacterized protein n=1 Tax=Cyphellophora europaea (strain CBS 101466) TaxID=1220924 RepID=W2SA23_CYPE1|nr:uncharacterized protein HMPREF1541_09312 [Cyphellophora europaea CBS 101466]ETN45480.1 hypothetical protein HMPREF1541_09312 [Cyphellophora europaea CBS 101466]
MTQQFARSAVGGLDMNAPGHANIVALVGIIAAFTILLTIIITVTGRWRMRRGERLKREREALKGEEAGLFQMKPCPDLVRPKSVVLAPVRPVVGVQQWMQFFYSAHARAQGAWAGQTKVTST